MIIDAQQIWSEAYLTTLKHCLSSGYGPPQAAQRARESADEALRVWQERLEEISQQERQKWEKK